MNDLQGVQTALSPLTKADLGTVEYWGTSTLDHAGTAIITLPGYFEAQADPGRRSVLLTPEGSGGSQLSYEPIIDGALTVHGTAGTTFSWLVKAVRIRIVLGVDSGGGTGGLK